MKLKFFTMVLFLSVLFFPAFPAEEPGAGEPDVFEFDRFLIDHFPGGYFYPFFFENYVPDATLLNEESNGFSWLDNPRVYFEGDSFIDFNWYYNGLNINSALDDGSPAVLLPFSSVDTYRLQGESPRSLHHGMNFVSVSPRESYSRLLASSVYSDLGGYWLTFMIQPDHPSTRADRLVNQRRKIKSNYFLDYLFSKNFAASHLTVALSYFAIQRQFNDFNTFDATFNEDGRDLLLESRFKKELKNGHYDLFGVFNYSHRSAQQAEIGVLPQETTGKKRFAFLTGLALEKKTLDLNLSLLVESEELSPWQKNFSKDLLDNDGDGLYPFGDTGELKIGTFSAVTANLNLRFPVTSRLFNRPIRLEPFADIRYSALKGDEAVHDYNALSVDHTPYLVVLWNRGNTYRNINMNAKGGVALEAEFSKNLSLLARLFLNVEGLYFNDSRNNLTFFTPAFDIGLLLFKSGKSRLLFSYGILPYEIRENTNFFLERERPYGALYHWNDTNGDHLYQPGEAGELFGYTGGQYHYADENLSAPLKERLLLDFSTPLSRHFRLNIKGIYKKIKNRFRVRFNQEYGFYELYEGQALYFFDKPFGDYYLANGGYEKDPFYAQFSFEIAGRRAGRWIFSFSFMAHMGMGDTAFGNGPGSNDIGILDESQANPNSWINGFGRLDGDRGFVAKSYFGYYLTKKLFMAVSLKYRDGNPFAFFNTLSRYDQRIFYYQTIKAENEKGVKGGPREDYIFDVSLKLSYPFKLLNRNAVVSLSAFNLLDFGAELSEYVFSGGTRDAIELQIPRSIRLTLDWQF
jgi:hypothetical protein